MVSEFTKKSCIPGMLLFGTATVVIQKYVFGMKALGKPGEGIVDFQKPWFQTESMFIGMLSCLIVYEGYPLALDSARLRRMLRLI